MAELYPAIDLRGGRAVRLTQGDYSRERVYGDDPVAIAAEFAAAGATWIHVVDLDAARDGNPVNRPVVAKIVAAVAGQASVQTGGGVRTAADATELAALGVARVVMGSAAVRNPAIVDDVAKIVAVAVGLDHRFGDLAVSGWTQSSGTQLDEALGNFPAASVFVITDISRDGMLEGPDIDGLRQAGTTSPIPVIASGGVTTLDDIRVLGRLPGIGGVIVGKALYEHRFNITEALAAIAVPT
jgi:phosphoribosylformimino-5-aminoimidazole carboxamide ribotide isomerase